MPPALSISVSEALDFILAEAKAQPIQSISLRHAAGRYLAAPVAAPHNSPPFDNSAMDGFAVRHSDLQSATASVPIVLPIQAEITAGGITFPNLEPGKAIRINTGARMPDGADAVVRIEDTKILQAENSSGTACVQFSIPVAPANAVRRAGEDYAAGQILLQPGHRLDPAAIGLLASLGLANVPVTRLPRVGLLATGDEIIEPGQPLKPSQIYNSTRYALFPLLESFGAEVHDLGTTADTPEATRKALQQGLDFDLLITTGGVSMGSRDLVRPTLTELGAKEIFWKVRQRPGQPLLFMTFDHGNRKTLCFGLPGNPVSVFVTALLYVRTALLKMQGADSVELPWRPAIAGAPFNSVKGLTVFSRADLRGAAAQQVFPSPAQGSHQFSVLSSARGLVRINEGSPGIQTGDSVELLEFARLFR